MQPTVHILLGLLLLHAPLLAAAQYTGFEVSSADTGQAIQPAQPNNSLAAATQQPHPAAQTFAPPQQAVRSSGQCVASLQASQQCGGNFVNAATNCTQLGSCSNTAWAVACCQGGALCTPLGPGQDQVCWSCGGTIPSHLAAASQNANAASRSMCLTQVGGSDYDYSCTLGASLLFYEAQRSGKLAATNRISWRSDSLLQDRAPNGASLAGGWYDAGDLTRFTFPAAFTIATLAISFLEFPQAYQQAGQTESILHQLKWGADWLNAARYQPDAFVAVTWAPGNSVEQSHMYWGKPEEMQQASKVVPLIAPMKGADLLGQGAAALAAVSVVFASRDPGYSEQLLLAADGLYLQATESEGLYSDSIPEVQGYYASYSYIDDLAWAAAWLALRTGDAQMLDDAKYYYDKHWSDEGGGEGRRFDYNNLVQGVGYLLAKLDPANKDKYTQPIRNVMNLWLTAGSDITFSPQGMAYIDSWGNLRYVANQAFIGLLHNKLYPEQHHRAIVYACFARKQARIMLGETGRSYVVGVGDNPPCRPHHRAASCLSPSAPGLPCDCSAFFNPNCNPNTLYGALVGGPNDSDQFTDTRWDYQSGEVALDWNAGFTGMLAGLSVSNVTWDDCVAAGMQTGRGQVSPALNAAGQQQMHISLWLLLVAPSLLLAL